MRGEGGKIFFDGLAVAHIAPDVVKDGKPRPLRRGHEQPARRHQAEQPAHLERDRLAARIGAADEQKSIFPAHRERDGHRLFGIQKRVTSLQNFDHAARIERGLDALDGIGVLCTRIEAVRLGEHRHVV